MFSRIWTAYSLFVGRSWNKMGGGTNAVAIVGESTGSNGMGTAKGPLF